MQSPVAGDRLNFYAMSTLSKAAAQCGFNIHDLLQHTGIGVEVSDNPQTLLSLPALARLFDQAEAASTASYFPLALGDNFAFDAMPAVETFIATCTTLRAAMKALDWMPYVVHPAMRLSSDDEGPMFRVRLLVDEQERLHPGVVEAALATAVKFSRLVLPQQDPLRLVWFRHQARAPREVYERFFGVPVQFGQNEDCLFNASASLDLPLKGSFPALNAQARLMVEQRIQQMGRQDGLRARLEQLLSSRPDLLGVGIEEVSALLEMHPRTLQRRLKEEGESFADVQTRVRRERARRLLRETDLDIEAISIKLGFRDRHSFTRAFTRWEGMPPGAYRKP